MHRIEDQRCASGKDTATDRDPDGEQALEGLFQAADQAIQDGANILILSDRTFDRDYAPIPALLASSGLHHHLIRQA